jgi:formylglycine-generating enzyme required for sulfatase activity
MVWIPAGSFRMGDIQGGGHDNEQPVHEVSVGQFAMGKYEVTVGEFRKFVNATGYQTDAEKQNSCWTTKDGGSSSQEGANWQNLNFSQNDNHPVTCVSWNDGTAYAEWLSNQTGKQYRLPTEAEWEYAARAGTETEYWWGNEIGSNNANCYSCGSQWDYKQTATVGSFAANQFGLYDTSGNLWEWSCSEYDSKYNGKEKVCLDKNTNEYRVLRGGSWYSHPVVIRSASRSRSTPVYRIDYIGFRLVRAAWTN